MAVNFFKRVTPSELKAYIPFNRNTRGTSGRAVYINPALLPRYIELINSKATNQMRLDAAIQGLRALAGGFTSDSNNNNAFCHRTQVDGVEIFYSILQDLGPTNKSGIYVTDLRVKALNGSPHSAGLHLAQLRQGSWTPNPVENNTPTTYFGAITGGVDSKSGDASIMSTCNSTGKRMFKKLGCRPVDYDLFFTPSSQVTTEGTWTTATQKRLPTGYLPRKLADAMIKVEKKNHVGMIKWDVSDQGAQILLQALKLLPTLGMTKLERQSFEVSNPYAPIGSLKLALKSVGYELTPEMVNLQSQSRGSIAHQTHTMDIGLAFKGNRNSLDKSVGIAQVPNALNIKSHNAIFSETANKALKGLTQGWS